MNIIEYQSQYLEAVNLLMAQLQDYERELSADRPPGQAIAEGHFKYLLSQCDQKSGRVFLALEDDSLIGFIVVIIETEEAGDLHLYPESKRYGLVTDLIVQEDHRGSGAAQNLLQRAEQHCAILGVDIMRITTLCANELARHFYKKSGYESYEIIYNKSIRNE